MARSLSLVSVMLLLALLISCSPKVNSPPISLRDMRSFIDAVARLGSLRLVAFSGGECFLLGRSLDAAVRYAAGKGLRTRCVSNAYWAISQDDAIAYLKPFQGLLADLSVSSDLYHYDEKLSRQVNNAVIAAEKLKIPIGVLSIDPPQADSAESSGQIPIGDSGVMYRGRAAEALAPKVLGRPWDAFTTCPHEDLRQPGRLHLDPLGNIHICQGISLGNLHERSLAEIRARYDPEAHPVCAPLLAGGPAELVRRYDLPHLEFQLPDHNPWERRLDQSPGCRLWSRTVS